MKFTGWTPEQISEVVSAVSVLSFGANLRFEETRSEQTRRGWTVLGVLRVRDSGRTGARLGPSGRRSVAASWEAHRDVMWGLFDLNPEGRIVTSIADYRGREDFVSKYRATRDRRVGSSTIGELSFKV